MKPLDHCNLCLSRVTDAVACPSAHVFCRECCYADLLAQKAGIAQQRAELDAWEAEDTRKRQDARERARARVVADFERGMGLSGDRVRIRPKPSGDGEKQDGEANGTSEGDLEDEAERRARAAEDAALAEIEREESDTRKAKIAAFWLPGNTPEAPLGPLKSVKLQTLCHVGTPHPISRKSLLPVQFTYPSAPKAPSSAPTDAKPACPSCLREVNNATGAVLLTSRKAEAGGDGDEPKKKKKKKDKEKKDDAGAAVCGHVVCATCAERERKGGNQCPVCEAEIQGAIPLGKEGTGFAAAGHSLAKADVVTFRV